MFFLARHDLVILRQGVEVELNHMAPRRDPLEVEHPVLVGIDERPVFQENPYPFHPFQYGRIRGAAGAGDYLSHEDTPGAEEIGFDLDACRGQIGGNTVAVICPGLIGGGPDFCAGGDLNDIADLEGLAGSQAAR